MKKIFVILGVLASLMLMSCGNMLAENNYYREQKTARFQSEYATTVNKLEMREDNFKTLRRVTFYNVRLGETVFAVEGYIHVQIDEDGDVEIVAKVGQEEYLRHYLGKSQDMIYFSEQLKPVEVMDYNRYQIVWNPEKWIPQFNTDLH